MATESFLCIPPGRQNHFDQPQVGGWCIFFIFFQRYWSLSQQLVVDHPSTLGSRVQELVNWLWGKCVEMYLSILNCVFACCKVIDSVAGGWRELRTDAPRSKSPPSGDVPCAPLMQWKCQHGSASEVIFQWFCSQAICNWGQFIKQNLLVSPCCTHQCIADSELQPVTHTGRAELRCKSRQLPCKGAGRLLGFYSSQEG